MSGEELARALYGVHGSEVTVRAEIAPRLRRRLGPLVASQPLHLVADVHADFPRGRVDGPPRRAGGGERPLCRSLAARLGRGSDRGGSGAARARLPTPAWRHNRQARAATPLQPWLRALNARRAR